MSHGKEEITRGTYRLTTWNKGTIDYQTQLTRDTSFDLPDPTAMKVVYEGGRYGNTKLMLSDGQAVGWQLHIEILDGIMSGEAYWDHEDRPEDDHLAEAMRPIHKQFFDVRVGDVLPGLVTLLDAAMERSVAERIATRKPLDVSNFPEGGW
jgi:hypothetical protein